MPREAALSQSSALENRRWWPWLLCLLWGAALLPTLDDPVTGRDSWRESDVLIVARNFCREATPLWAPRVDARGDGPGITGMELPLLNAAAGALGCRGVDLPTAARALVWLSTLLAGLALYALARAQLGAREALLALALFLTSPLALYYGRAAMPDMPALALALGALALLQRGTASPWRVLAGGALFALAGAVKLPALVLGAAAAAWAWPSLRAGSARERLLWLAGAALALLPPLLWLAHARALQEIYGLRLFNISRSPAELWADWRSGGFWLKALLQQPFDTTVFPGVTVLAICGLFIGRRQLPRWLWAMAAGVLAGVLAGGAVGAHHAYYALPGVPLLCLLAAWLVGRVQVPRRWAAAATALVLAAAVYGAQRVRGWFADVATASDYAQARDALWRARPQREKVVLYSGGNPSLLWWLDRPGWVDPGPELISSRRLPAAVVAVDHRPVDPPPVAELEAALEALPCRALARRPRVSLWLCGNE